MVRSAIKRQMVEIGLICQWLQSSLLSSLGLRRGGVITGLPPGPGNERRYLIAFSVTPGRTGRFPRSGLVVNEGG